MNREERRKLGVSKETADRVNQMNSPCTITEAVQISRGVAEDVVADFQKRTSTFQIALSLQVDLLKKIVIDKGLITEEEFRELYIAAAEEYNKLAQGGEPQEANNPKMEINADDIVIEKK